MKDMHQERGYAMRSVWERILKGLILFGALGLVLTAPVSCSSKNPHLPTELDPLYDMQGKHPDSRIVFFSYPSDLEDVLIVMSGVAIKPEFPGGKYVMDGRQCYAHLIVKDVTQGEFRLQDGKKHSFQIRMADSKWRWAIELYHDEAANSLKLRSQEEPTWAVN